MNSLQTSWTVRTFGVPRCHNCVRANACSGTKWWKLWPCITSMSWALMNCSYISRMRAVSSSSSSSAAMSFLAFSSRIHSGFIRSVR